MHIIVRQRETLTGTKKRVKGRPLSILIYVCPPLYIEKKTINSNKLSCPGASGVCFDRGDESQTQTCCLL